MFYEYAMIPDVFEPDLLYCDATCELALMHLLDGIVDSGMVAALHKGELRSHIASLVSAANHIVNRHRRTDSSGIQCRQTAFRRAILNGLP